MKNNRDEFFVKVAVLYKDKNDYSESVYINCDTQITIRCVTHGYFKTTPYRHLRGTNCPQCRRDKLPPKKENCNLKYCEEHQLEYKSYRAYRDTSCSLCKKEVRRKKREEVFLNKVKEVYKDNNKYDFSKVFYTESYNLVTVICSEHGEFEQYPSCLLKNIGCQKCGKVSQIKKGRIPKKEVLRRFIEKHENFYKYPNFDLDYTDNYPIFTITCPIHGNFTQNVHTHFGGSGCSECAKLKISIKNKEHSTGWIARKWEAQAVSSKKFDSFKVYLIRCFDENEEFYKIGRTFKKVDKRVSSIPYKKEVITYKVFENAEDCCNFERSLKTTFKDSKYTPAKIFNGYSECFTISTKEIKTTIERL